MAALVLLAAAAYMTVDVNFGNAKLLAYSMRIRAPKLIVMLITAFASAGPRWCSSPSSTTHRHALSVGHELALHAHPHGGGVLRGLGERAGGQRPTPPSAIDLVLMGITATLIYSYLFKKTKHNVLYVLLVARC